MKPNCILPKNLDQFVHNGKCCVFFLASAIIKTIPSLKLAHLLGRDGDKEGGVEEFDAVDDTFGQSNVDVVTLATYGISFASHAWFIWKSRLLSAFVCGFFINL